MPNFITKFERGHPKWGRQRRNGVGKIISFLSLSMNISKMVADMAKVTINDKYKVTYRLSIDIKIDDFG